MFDDRLFFQIAAGLIPAILFGGFVTGAFTPSETDPPRDLFHRVAWLITVAVGVGLVLLAEIVAIDIATSPERPAGYKVAVVVTAVVGATTLAGAALLLPWIKELPPPYEHLAGGFCLFAGGLIALVGIAVLTGSIVEAQQRLEEQQAACLRTEGNRRLRESGRDEFDALQAAGALGAEQLRLREERVRLRHEEGLRPSERAARERLLQRQLDGVEARLDLARNNYEAVVRESALTVEQLGLDQNEGDKSADDVIESFLRAFGC